MRFSKDVLGWALLLMTTAACGGGGDDSQAGSGGNAGMAGMGGAGGMSEPTGDPTFSAIYKEIFIGEGCNAAPLCHGGGLGELEMKDKDSTYAALVDVPAMGTNLPPGGTDCVDTGLIRVVRGDADASLLVQKVEEAMPVCGNRMPTGGSLSDDQIEQIRMWVENGAKND